MSRGSVNSAAATLFLATTALHAPTVAQPADQFFKGKQIKLIVGSNAGGNYDQYGRFLARHMGKHIPGAPSFVVQNMPAAGGIQAANILYNVAPKDGLTIAHLQRTIPQAALVGLPGTEYDATPHLSGSAASSARCRSCSATFAASPLSRNRWTLKL